MFNKCPECGNYTLAFDSYDKIFICYNPDCNASELTSIKIKNIVKELRKK